ncbi:MAG: hypothetical protein KF757_09715 [Phycisphaeraceae bacterium]|nr:hypothetical protein [Phycisphaeraceae bacterium]MCW5763488.1 hypothetical protein [Phycisphaeraceae bacterium]
MQRMIGFLTVVGIAALAGAGVRVDLIVYENADNADVSILDLWVNLVDGGTYVDFTFHNDSTGSATVANVYFEANSLMSGGSIVGQSAGVSFTDGGSPPNPAQPGFLFGGAWGGNLYSASANPPPSMNGIDPGETLTVRFTLVGSFADVLAAVQPNAIGGLRIAQHVINLGEFSVWTINTPSPGSIALLGFGAACAVRRRR